MEWMAVKKPKKTERFLQMLTEGISAWAICAGFMLCFCSWLELTFTPELILAGTAAGVLIFLLISSWKYGMFAGILLLGMTVSLFMTGYQESMLNGMLALSNEASRFLGKNGIFFWQEYALLSDANALTDAQMFLVCVSVIIGAVMTAAQKGCRKLTAAIGMILAAAFLCINAYRNPWLLLLAAGTCTSTVCAFYYGKKKYVIANGHKMAAYASVLVLVFLGLGLWSRSIILPEEEYEESQITEELREAAWSGLDQFRYKKEKVNTLPKGNLTKAETWETTEETALKITMSEPTSLYLRGFVGSVYEKDGWQELSPEIRYESGSLFYWLKQAGMTANTQLAFLWKNLPDEMKEQIDPEQSEYVKTQITIENINADSEYIYLPYELITLDEEETLLYNEMQDGGAKAAGVFGERSYTYTSWQNLVKDFPQAAAQSYLYRRIEPDTAYAEAESYYNVFAYENYTELPNDTRSLLYKELGYAAEKEEHADYRSVIQKISKYLNENLTYGKYAEALPEDEDFLKFFLKESKIGNSVHYATAAALMFRYYGIPARYVEGYLLTPEDVKHAGQGQPIELPGSRGHAWCEIYVDGLGWVPIEMTPGYEDVMEQPDLMKGLQADSSVVIKPPENDTQNPQTNQPENLKERLSGIFLDLAKILLWMLICFDLFCLLVFLFLYVRRQIANLKRSRKFRCRDNKAAICSMTGYMGVLVQETGSRLPEDAKCIYEDVYKIGQKAAFSPFDMTADERRTVSGGRKYLLKVLKKKKGWYEKWILKYIERLY